MGLTAWWKAVCGPGEVAGELEAEEEVLLPGETTETSRDILCTDRLRQDRDTHCFDLHTD